MHRSLRSHLIVWWLAIRLAGVAASAFASAGLPAWNSRPWQTEDGLPDISITGLAQTTDGYLWVATKGGLACFNGQQFSTVPMANFPMMPSRAVRAMFRDHRDWLWLGMERGPVLCLKTDGLESFAAADGLPEWVGMIMEDGEGAVWVIYQAQLRRILNGKVQAVPAPDGWQGRGNLLATSDTQGEIWCARGNFLAVWRKNQWQSQTRFDVEISAISPAGKSGLWVATGESLLRFNEGQTPVIAGKLPARAKPTALLESHAGVLWIGTVDEGLFLLNRGEFKSVPTSQREITCLFEDREENILAGTAGGGLNLIRPQAVALLGRGSGLPFESVLSVSEDSERSLWAVSQDGRLARGLDGTWEVVSASSNWPGGRASCVAADPKGGVWVGTRDRGLKHLRDGVWHEWLPGNGLAAEGVRSLLVGSNGDIWVASLGDNRLQRLRNGVVQSVTNTTHLGPIRALAEGADGTIWIGTSEGEIQKVRDLTLMAEPAIKEPVPLSVRVLLATPDGSLWIGYAGDGLGHLKDGRYQRLTSEVGLTDDFITQLLDDGGVNLWIAGNRGLSRVSFDELDAVIAGKSRRMSMQRYGSADGLPALQPSRDYWPSAWSGRDGRLWFAMRNGVLAVQSDKISGNPSPPIVQLERVLVDDQLVALYNAGSPLQTLAGSNLINLRRAGAKLHLDPGHRKLEIDFAALSFTSPENVQFRYQLSGFDSEWVEVGFRHSATYPRLPAGNYEFRVIACNNTGVWDMQGAVLAFTVAPFFWETWWFKIGGGISTALIAGGCAFAISRTRYRRRIQRLENRRALEQERVRIARDIHDDLGASLTRISLLSQPSGSDPEDQEAAAASLAQIHHTARDLTHAMGEVVWAVNPEHDTFDSLANYISNYAQNFLRAARIRCRLEMPVQVPQLVLSSGIRHNLLLAFKEALNNAAKHAEASEVQISLTANDSRLELLVADNGKGFFQRGASGKDVGTKASRPARGNGLTNMCSRLREIGGDCDIQSGPGAGTRIIFRVSLTKDHGRR